MIDLKRKDRQTIDRPSRAFRIDRSVRQYFHVLVFIQKETIDQLYQIRTILIRLVDAAFDSQRFHRVDLRIPDNVLQMPLDGIDPVLKIKIKLDALYRIGIMHCSIYIVSYMISLRSLLKNAETLFAEVHI